MKKILTILIRKNLLAFHILFFFCKLKRRSWRNHRLLKLVWLDQVEGVQRTVLRRSRRGVAYAPRFIGKEERAETEVVLPNICVRIFQDVVVSAHSSSLQQSQQVIVERVSGVNVLDCSYAAGHVIMHGVDKAVVNLSPPIQLEKGIFLGGNGAFNYYHWLLELAPKCEWLGQLPEICQDFPLLVSEDVRKIDSFQSILRSLVGGSQIIYLDPVQRYQVKQLAYIDTANSLPFNLRAGVQCHASHFRFWPETVAYLRQAFHFETAPGWDGGHCGKKVFLCRNNNRRSYNQDEVFSCLERYGFEKVYMEMLTFQEQIEVMQQAEWIVGPTGAAWTNLLFARPGTKALCWMALEYGDFSAFSTLAETVGVEMYCLTFRTDAKSTGDLGRKAYTMDCAHLKDFIETHVKQMH